MTEIETGKVLALFTTAQPTLETKKGTLAAWHELIGELPFPLAWEAAKRVQREGYYHSETALPPVEKVLGAAAAIERERNEAVPALPAPSEEKAINHLGIEWGLKLIGLRVNGELSCDEETGAALVQALWRLGADTSDDGEAEARKEAGRLVKRHGIEGVPLAHEDRARHCPECEDEIIPLPRWVHDADSRSFGSPLVYREHGERDFRGAVRPVKRLRRETIYAETCGCGVRLATDPVAALRAIFPTGTAALVNPADEDEARTLAAEGVSIAQMAAVCGI